MLKKRITLILVIALFLIVLCYISIKFINADNIYDDCFSNDFKVVFDKENSIKLNKTYDFSKILNCKNWDEVIIVS